MILLQSQVAVTKSTYKAPPSPNLHYVLNLLKLSFSDVTNEGISLNELKSYKIKDTTTIL